MEQSPVRMYNHQPTAHGMHLHMRTQTGYNQVVCAFALGDKDAMRNAFLGLIGVGHSGVEDDDDEDLAGLLGGEEDDMRQVGRLVRLHVVVMAVCHACASKAWL